MGADKWAQVRDPAWYGGDVRRATPRSPRCPACSSCPRPGFDVERRRDRSTSTPTSRTCRRPRARAGEHHLVAPEARRRLIVDGNNVIGSRPDGWWRDRDGRGPPAVGAAAGVRAAAPATASRSCSTAVRSPTSRRACTTACSSRTRAAAGATRPTTASSRRSSATAIPASLTVVTSDRELRAPRARASARAVEGASRVAQRSGIGTPVTPSSRSTRNVFSAIDTRWYCPTVNTRSSSCCSS